MYFGNLKMTFALGRIILTSQTWRTLNWAKSNQTTWFLEKTNQPHLILSKGKCIQEISLEGRGSPFSSNQVIWWSEMNGCGVETGNRPVAFYLVGFKTVSVRGYSGRGCEKSQTVGLWTDMTPVFSLAKIHHFCQMCLTGFNTGRKRKWRKRGYLWTNKICNSSMQDHLSRGLFGLLKPALVF